MPTGTDESSEMIGIAALVAELHEASREAAANGYPGMARMLDECGFELGAANRNNRQSLVERARKSLDVWRALHAW